MHKNQMVSAPPNRVQLTALEVTLATDQESVRWTWVVHHVSIEAGSMLPASTRNPKEQLTKKSRHVPTHSTQTCLLV
jgi:hypothetical protein